MKISQHLVERDQFLVYEMNRSIKQIIIIYPTNPKHKKILHLKIYLLNHFHLRIKFNNLI